MFCELFTSKIWHDQLVYSESFAPVYYYHSYKELRWSSNSLPEVVAGFVQVQISTLVLWIATICRRCMGIMWMEFLFVYCYFLCFRSVFHFIFRPANIYNEPAVYEVQRALPVITELRTRIEELLLEWPDHPGLKQVLSDMYCPVITHSNASMLLECFATYNEILQPSCPDSCKCRNLWPQFMPNVIILSHTVQLFPWHPFPAHWTADSLHAM